MIRYSLKDSNYSDVSPEKFLTLLSNAQYVVTNSFHATALSLLFTKKFSVVVKGGCEALYNSRIFSLLSRYGLENRITERFCDNVVQDCIDFTIFNEKFEVDRKQSVDFLRRSILDS